MPRALVLICLATQVLALRSRRGQACFQSSVVVRSKFLPENSFARRPSSPAVTARLPLTILTVRAGKDDVEEPLQPSSSPVKAGPDFSSYVDLLRAHNILPSMFVCMLGAWVGTHDLRHTLFNPTVLLVAVISALVAVGSCVLNDYFDLRIDAINKPERSLVQGGVRPSTALLIGSGLLTAAFAAATPTLISSPLLRRIIRAAVLAVTLYTPIFKPVPLVKNAVVAGVTSASLVLGGLASGASLHQVTLPAVLVFLAVLHREVLMDIDDVEGDTQCGIWTVPRILGKPGALASAAGLLALGVLVVAHQLMQQSSGGFVPGLLVSLAGAATCAYDVSVAKKGFQHEDLSRVINISVVPMALALVAMGIGGTAI